MFPGANFHVYTCARSTDVEILERDLRRSPAIARGDVKLTVLWNQPSASSAYARAIASAKEDILIFAHCDVFFPEYWFERLDWEIRRLTQQDSQWAVAGMSSVTAAGDVVGRTWDASLAPLFPQTGGIHGGQLKAPVPVVSVDELAIIVRRDSGVSFDPLLPEFHLYGADIVLEAERLGRSCYGLDLPLIHNAKAQLSLGRDYVRSYRYMVRKWRDRLPVQTTCGTISRNPLVLPMRRLRMRHKAMFRRSTYSTQRASDPSAKSRELGMDRMLAASLSENGCLTPA
ncbi:glycosyltransferase family 2 protein [Bradyrhizobium liaoningense]|uniref:glycosyltransferase family 2 protein n=1 Tax=Bradyrhizobium liaoningense TaxID=43992 RepID=UPI001BA79E95|nr:glycosyltransferase family 2 protein [Bradyrhizobium liaoningense]MBR0740750.1 glycosyltransferase family 2 protein [Bradyrhizobium liaoningense]